MVSKQRAIIPALLITKWTQRYKITCNGQNFAWLLLAPFVSGNTNNSKGGEVGISKYLRINNRSYELPPINRKPTKMCRTYGAVRWCLCCCYKATEPTARRKKNPNNGQNSNS
jgi:hypothetical protein